jgi:hypothetical protein
MPEKKVPTINLVDFREMHRLIDQETPFKVVSVKNTTTPRCGCYHSQSTVDLWIHSGWNVNIRAPKKGD